MISSASNLGIGILPKPTSPELRDAGLALNPPAIRRRRDVLENCVFGQQVCEGIRVVAVENLVETLDDQRRLPIHHRAEHNDPRVAVS